jgi:carboxyl-terminal processing protease
MMSEDSSVVLDCEGGGRMELEVYPARPQFGLGFSYALRSNGSAITDVFEQSPAERAGVREGDEIIEVMGKPVSSLSAQQLKSTINANASTGLTIVLRTGQAAPRELRLLEGPIYSIELP